MALSKDEQAQLDALTRKASEPDDDFDIEIWDETGAGAKVPYSRGRSFLARFGIDVPETPPEDQGQGDEGDTGKAPKTRQPKPDNVRHAQRYFGNKPKAS